MASALDTGGRSWGGGQNYDLYKYDTGSGSVDISVVKLACSSGPSKWRQEGSELYMAKSLSAEGTLDV